MKLHVLSVVTLSYFQSNKYKNKWDGMLFLAREKNKLILLYKIKNGLCPDYLSSLVLHTVGNNTAYNLRNASNYKYICSNTQLYYNSFLPSLVRDGNELLHTTKMLQELALLSTSFKIKFHVLLNFAQILPN